ncbi:hypothetical protein HDU79_006142 [Rhizoclosmatium sp. JEL0117]|nr:hypothetical protein HDU79_006142 [Rhizoclosmatium sp. JEL0117]
MSLNSPILTLPRELLDELVSYLDSKSMLRFCRAIPQLTDYADIVSDVARTLNERLSFIWPNLFIFITNREAFDESHRPLITRLSALVTRFNGNTILRDFEPAKIAQVCTMASQNIDLTIRIPDVAALWVEQLRIQRKLVHRLDLQSFPPRIIAVVPDLNPEELRCSSKDILLEDLKSCTRLRRLELELLTGSSNALVLSAILVQLPNLRVLELTSADKKSFIGVTQALPATNIHRVRYEYNPAIENEDMWGAEEEDSYYIGDEENEFVDLFSKASFVFKAVVMKRNTSEFVKKEWIEEEGFWHRMAVGNGESRR